MSRIARATKTAGNRLEIAPSQQEDSNANPSRRTTALKSNPAQSSNSQVVNDDDDYPDTRPTKRRKLEIRGPRQQTLDSFFSNNPLRPPVKIAATPSNGTVVKTINGVQDELPVNIDAVIDNGTNGLEAAPSAAKKLKAAQTQKKEEKRTLRSQDDGPRLKSELATYFNNYEDIIFDTPREPELLDVETSIHISDDAPAKGDPLSPPTKTTKHTRTPSRHESGPLPPPNAVKLDFDSIMQALPAVPDDPLTDDTFLVSHRRAERKEKQMRNIEREHAMHEKVQLERLLDGLLGHDWLRVLGITGVTDSEAKKFESKRAYFIEEVRILVDKFNAWKDEEKRQKYEKEAMLAAEREADDDDDDSTEVSSTDPASSELNLSASRQLQQETASAMRSLSVARAKRKERVMSNCAPSTPVPYRPPSPIVSFYSSRHMRESALKRTRNSRNLTAFGLPIPEVSEREFVLPADYITEDVLRASARERRRKKRETVANGVSRPP